MVTRALRVGEGRKFKGYEKRAEAINRIEPEMELLDDAELRQEADDLRKRATDGEALDDLLPEAFALTREAARRSIGQRHYDVQLIGGMVLHEGAIAEMKTGEGKTLTATLAVFLNTLAGDGASTSSPSTTTSSAATRNRWGRSTTRSGSASPPRGDDHATRQRKYSGDVVYVTNSELVVDYLRDNMVDAHEHCVQPGHHLVIVDEVDSLLIDEARTPLIICNAPEGSPTYNAFARLAKQMDGVQAKEKLRSLGESKDTSEAEHDYDSTRSTDRLADRKGANGPRSSSASTTSTSVARQPRQPPGPGTEGGVALQKGQGLRRGDGQVQIIDEFTGRVLEGRRWRHGLHQAIEVKEGVPITADKENLATITFQNFFRQYDMVPA